MQRLAHFLLMAGLTGLTGCAARGPVAPYGNFLKAPTRLNEMLAADTVKRLASLYPPARTRFELAQPAFDAYGAALVASLRAKGYAVLESKTEPPQGMPPGLPLRYVLDAPGNTNLVRVTVLVGPQSLSRAYEVQADSAVPAGAWVRKE